MRFIIGKEFDKKRLFEVTADHRRVLVVAPTRAALERLILRYNKMCLDVTVCEYTKESIRCLFKGRIVVRRLLECVSDECVIIGGFFGYETDGMPIYKLDDNLYRKL